MVSRSSSLMPMSIWPALLFPCPSPDARCPDQRWLILLRAPTAGSARLRIVGQAPGREVHETGVPWDDASGARLQAWLGLSAAHFYDPAKAAIMPMGFCYPGKGASADNPPRRECAPRWHVRLSAELPAIGLTVLLGPRCAIFPLARQRRPTRSGHGAAGCRRLARRRAISLGSPSTLGSGPNWCRRFEARSARWDCRAQRPIFFSADALCRAT
jgi:uracil-DNA glycosylase